MLSTRPMGSAWCAGFVGFSLLTLCQACASPGAWAGPASPAVNLALGKPYTLSPAPSYPHCTDLGDTRQLTDGRTADAFWTRKSTVGWQRPGTPPTVLIDLKRVAPIGEVRVHTIGGGNAGVYFPATALVMVSDDNRVFRAVGVAHNLGLPQVRSGRATAPKRPHVSRIGPLKTRGRFVLVLLEADGPYVFVDEIEVFRGTHQSSTVTFLPENRFRRAAAPTLLTVARQRAELPTLLQSLKVAAADLPDEGSHSRLDELAQRLRTPEAVYDLAEIRRLSQQIYGVRGRLLQQREKLRLAWTVANPMEQISPAAVLPAVSQRCQELRVCCWRGEYESAAVTLLNCGPSPLRLRASVSPLQHTSGTAHPAEPTVTLRRAVVVRSRSLGPINDALVKLSSTGFVLPGGQTGQLWLTFHDAALPPDEYSFVLRVMIIDEADELGKVEELTIPGRLTVDALTFPTRPSLKTCTWSYVRQGSFTSNAPREALADLQTHYVNVFVLTAQEIALPRLGRDGRLRVDFNRHAAALWLYHDAELYLFFWARTKQRPNWPGFPERLSPAWKTLMKTWLQQWVAYLRRNGIGYDRFALYPFDEYIGDEFYELARFIKEEVDPRIRIFANSRGDNRGQQMQRIAPYIDIWCLPDRVIGFQHPAHERALQARTPVWTYAARGPSKANAPYDYYRLQMWRAFARGDQGCGFWTYARLDDAAGTGWDDRSGGAGPYGVVYAGNDGSAAGNGEAIIPSRRWEAWREGVEDYEYLSRLKNAAQTARDHGHAQDAERAERVLNRAVRDVLRAPDDPTIVYAARRALVAAIMELEGMR